MQNFILVMLVLLIGVACLTVAEGVRDIRQSRERNINKAWARYQAQSCAKGIQVERTREWEEAEDRKLRLLAWFGALRIVVGVVLFIPLFLLFFSLLSGHL